MTNMGANRSPLLSDARPASVELEGRVAARPHRPKRRGDVLRDALKRSAWRRQAAFKLLDPGTIQFARHDQLCEAIARRGVPGVDSALLSRVSSSNFLMTFCKGADVRAGRPLGIGRRLR
jgi:hypothetical protein